MTATNAGATRPSGARPERPRLDHVDGIRALAALVVYLNHAYAQVWGDAGPQPQGPFSFVWWSLVAGHLAVTVFIVVSGFCLMLPVLEHGTRLRGGFKTFLARRARRIIPPYYAAIALCLALIATLIGKPTGTLWDFPIKVNLTSIAVHILLLQDIFSTSHINYVFWSIAVEWQIYLLMPLLVWSWRRFGPVPVVSAALVLGYAVRIAFSDTRIMRAHPHFVGMFALGMLAATIARSDSPRLVKLRETVPWTALCGVSLLAPAAMIRLKSYQFIDLPVGVLAVCMLLASATARGGVVKSVLSWQPLVFVGTFSYSLYLIHAPLLQILWQYVFEPLGLAHEVRFVILMTLGLGLVLVLSYLFFLLFEAPFMGSARKARAGAPAAAPAP